jgi:cytosine/adenosine deaminase-related metal-dependent hydrolase
MSMVPGQEPIRDAAIVHDGRFIVQIAPWNELRARFDGPVEDLGGATLCPGVFNSHTHLEMCHLLGKTVRGQGFTSWIKSLVANPMYDMDDAEVAGHCRQIRQLGTAHVADISTRQAPRIAGVLDDSGLFFVAFREMIFFSPPPDEQDFVPGGEYANGVLSCAGHAPYSTHPETLRRAKRACAARGLPHSIHLAENEEESRILMGERIEFVEVLERANIPMTGFEPPRVSPVRYALDLGLLDPDTLAVHCVTVSDEDIDILRRTGTNVCLCPRSNDYIGEGRAPWEKLRAAGVNLCLGTDGLASNHDLDVWNELAFLKERFADEMSLEDGLALLTRNPAKAFRADKRLGTLAPGKAARWSVVPEHVLALFEA